MTPIVLLSALLVGQGCPNGRCGLPTAPSFSGGYDLGLQGGLLQMPTVLQAPIRPAQPRRVVKTRTTNFDGLTFEVRGVHDSGLNEFAWDWSDDFNVQNYRAAKARRDAAKVAEKPERKPTAKIDPLPEPKAEATRTAAAVDPFPGGVIAEKLGKRIGFNAPSAEAKRFVAEATSPAESIGKLHVTVIGSDDARAPVVNDLNTHPAFADLKADLMVQDYKPDEWPVDPTLGFVTNGKPSIIVQAAKGPQDPKGGRVIYRALDYSMGPAVLAQAIRKADPNYKPGTDPGPATGKEDFDLKAYLSDPDNRPFVIALGVAVVALLKMPRKEG